MNLADHPLAIDISKRLKRSPEGCIPGQAFFLGMAPMSGSIRAAEDNPGLFIIAAPVQESATGPVKIIEFSFTADKLNTIAFPELEPEEKRIIT